MSIALGSDHAGVHLKNELKHAFDKSYSAGTVKHTYVDFGTDSTHLLITLFLLSRSPKGSRLEHLSAASLFAEVVLECQSPLTR